MVTTGKERGKIGKVLKVLPGIGSVFVEKTNMVRRNMKPQGDRPGGVVEKEASIHISNVALWNVEEGRRVKARWERIDDGGKARFDKKTGNRIDG